MKKQMFIEAINAIYYKISRNAKSDQLFESALRRMNNDDAELLGLIDINADDKLWKVISNIAEWMNNHAA